MPKVSVVMPVFNGESYIGDSIRSVLAQEGADLELIIVNDGSTDGTLEVVEAFAKADDRLRVINRPNSGRPSFPKNDGLAAARGEYLCFLDHDDLYDAERTRYLVEGLDQHPHWIAAFHDLRFIDSHGGALPGTYLTNHDLLTHAKAYLTPMAGNWFECSEWFYVYQSLAAGALHTQSVLIAINRLPPNVVSFDTQFTICDDTDLWIRLGMQGKMGYLNRVLSSYRQHDTSITRNAEKYLLDTVKVHRHNYDRVKSKLTNGQVRQLRRRIAACISSVAYLYFQKLRLKEARVAYSEAWFWSSGVTAFVGYLKTFIPKPVLLAVRQLQKRGQAF